MVKWFVIKLVKVGEGVTLRKTLNRRLRFHQKGKLLVFVNNSFINPSMTLSKINTYKNSYNHNRCRTERGTGISTTYELDANYRI